MNPARGEPLRAIALVLGAAAMAVSFMACSATANPTGTLSVSDVLGGAPGGPVTVKGRYAGWKGACKGSPPRTRSDWMLVDDTSCIYVSGPVPSGLTAPPDPTSEGTPVVVHGRVERAEDGRLYVKLLPK